MQRLIKSKAFLLLAVVGLMACSRKEEPVGSSSLHLNFPQHLRSSKQSDPIGKIVSQKISDLPAGYLPSHLVINVHSNIGGGGLLAKFNWDGCNDDCQNLQPMPTSVSLNDIPNGPGRLVQVLVVGEDPTGVQPGYIFMYGDATVNLNGGEASVLIDPVVQGQAGSDVNLMGRYLTGPNEGPTGPIQVLIPTPDGKPDMLLGEDYMYGGYFRTFFVEGAGFIHHMPEQGLTLFDYLNGSINSISGGSHIIKVENPTYHTIQMMGYGGSSSTTVDRVRKKGAVYLGYFSESSSLYSGKQVASHGNSVIPDAYLNYDSTSNTWSNPLMWVSSGGTTNDVRVTWGSLGSPSGQEFQDHFYLKSYRYKNGPHDGLVGLRGPYKTFPSTSGSSGGGGYDQLVQWSSNSNGDMLINFATAPGVYSGDGAITGTTIMYKYDPYTYLDEFRIKDGDGLSCSALSAAGFSSVYVDQASGTAGSFTSTLDFGTPITDCNYSNAKVVLCPTRYNGAQMLPSGQGAYLSSSSGTGCGGGGGGGGGGGAYYKLDLRDSAGNLFEKTIISDSTCKAGRVYLTASGGTITSAPYNMNISLNGFGDLYLADGGASCGGMASSSANVVLGSGSQYVDFLYKGNPSSQGFFSGIMASTSSADGVDVPVNVVPASFSNPNGIEFDGETRFAHSLCYHIHASLTYDDGSGMVKPTVHASPITLNISSSYAPLSFYSDPGCTSSISSLNYPVNVGLVDFYVKSAGSGQFTSQSISGTVSTPVPIPTTPGVASMGFDIDNATISQLSFVNDDGYRYEYDQCHAIQVYTANAVGARVPPGTDYNPTINFASGTGAIYTNGSCVGGSSTYNPTLYSGIGDASFYVKATSTSYGLTSSSPTGNQTMNMRPTTIAATPGALSVGTNTTCTPITVTIRDTASNPYNAPVNEDIKVNFSSGAGSLYVDGGCSSYFINSSGTSAVKSVPSGSSSFTIYYISPGTGPTGVIFFDSDSNPSASASVSINP